MINGVMGVARVPPPQADPDLQKARRMLADWETCPSGKTSAGQAKIKQYTAQVSELAARDNKAQLEKSTAPASDACDGTPIVAAEPARAAAAENRMGPRAGTAGTALGASIDVFV